MNATAISLAPPGAITTAKILSVGPDGALAVEGKAFGRARARAAIPGGYTPRAGDTVLVAACDDGARWVVGVIAALRGAAPAAVEASDGSRATIEPAGSGEAIRVRDGRGRLLFEHLPAEGRSVVHAPEGDLELAAPGKVRITAGEAVEVKAPRADVEVGEARLSARSLTTAVESALHVVETLEVRAGRVIERARETYREVEDLAQTHAGRLRLVAAGALDLLGRRTQIKAELDLKLKGDKIYLG
jgi:hypothetical protein